LEPEDRKGEEQRTEEKRREGRSVVRYYFYYGRRKFTAVKIARQCPLVLLVKVGWGQR
jgi:hypothetical protein